MRHAKGKTTRFCLSRIVESIRGWYNGEMDMNTLTSLMTDIRVSKPRNLDWLENIHSVRATVDPMQVTESGYWYNIQTRMVEFWVCRDSISWGFLHTRDRQCLGAVTYEWLNHVVKSKDPNALEHALRKFEDNIVITCKAIRVEKVTEFRLFGT